MRVVVAQLRAAAFPVLFGVFRSIALFAVVRLCRLVFVVASPLGCCPSILHTVPRASGQIVCYSCVEAGASRSRLVLPDLPMASSATSGRLMVATFSAKVTVGALEMWIGGVVEFDVVVPTTCFLGPPVPAGWLQMNLV
jgi:hypothetical protein